MSKQATKSYTITQQALNLVRQLVNAKGWATTIEDIYLGGKLLAKDLPQLEPLDWVKTEAEIVKMSDDERKAYLERDNAWGNKPVEVKLTTAQVAVIKRAFTYFTDESGKAKQLGPNTYLFELIEVLGLCDAKEETE